MVVKVVEGVLEVILDYFFGFGSVDFVIWWRR